MRWIALTALMFSSLCLGSFGVAAEPLVWGVKADNLEYRLGKGPKNLFAWDTEAFVGSDELKFVWRSEGEFETQADAFETLENQLLLQTPISTFFDAVAGVRAETPKGPDRLSGVIGIKGLSKQWFDVEADLFLSEYPAARLAIDYEGLLTNRIILTPSIEVNLPFNDDRARAIGAWGPKVEVGARLSYDLVDRLLSPYIGIHHERTLGESAKLRSAEGEGNQATYLVTGVRVIF